MFKNYIFDMYGTLVDLRFNETDTKMWQQMALFFSYNHARYFSEELKKSYFREVEKDIWNNKLSDFPDVDIEETFRRLYRSKGCQPSEALITHTARLFRALSTLDIGLYDNAAELLKILKQAGKRLYILSNAQRTFSMPELEYLGIDHYFDGIVFSSDLKVCKPDQKIFTHLLESENLRAAESVMIGNDHQTDILGASLVGMATIYFHSNHSGDLPADPGTDLVINNGNLLQVASLTGMKDKE